MGGIGICLLSWGYKMRINAELHFKCTKRSKVKGKIIIANLSYYILLGLLVGRLTTSLFSTKIHDDDCRLYLGRGLGWRFIIVQPG